MDCDERPTLPWSQQRRELGALYTAKLRRLTSARASRERSSNYIRLDFQRNTETLEDVGLDSPRQLQQLLASGLTVIDEH